MKALSREQRVNRRVAWSLGAAFAALAIFQLFLRYYYVHTSGTQLVRIDRLTGESCVMPCDRAPVAAASPEASPFDQDEATASLVRALNERDGDAVELAKASPQVHEMEAALRSLDTTNFTWSTDSDLAHIIVNNIKAKNLTSGAYSAIMHVMALPTLVSYCSPQGKCWFWQVNLEKQKVRYVNDNADLMKQYNLSSRK